MDSSKKAKRYIIDTSALVRIFRFYPGQLLEPVWAKLEILFESGILFSHRLVYDEITTGSKKQDILSEKVKPLKKYFLTLKYEQVKWVNKIIQTFPGLIDPNREKDQADPWLIALAIEENQQLHLFDEPDQIVIVSMESEEKQNRIPAVCKHFGIKHLNLDRFFEEIGISFEVRS